MSKGQIKIKRRPPFARKIITMKCPIHYKGLRALKASEQCANENSANGIKARDTLKAGQPAVHTGLNEKFHNDQSWPARAAHTGERWHPKLPRGGTLSLIKKSKATDTVLQSRYRRRKCCHSMTRILVSMVKGGVLAYVLLWCIDLKLVVQNLSFHSIKLLLLLLIK